MAKAPTKTPIKRQVRITKSTEVQNMSRAAGAPTAPSAAATAPQPGPFYSADASRSPAAIAESIVQDAAAEQQNPLRAAHNHEVDRRTVRDESLADVGVDQDIALAAHVADGGAQAAEEGYEEQVARIRTIRRPLGSFSQKLALEARSGYHRHWFNDEGGRIDDASSNGWAHVMDRDRKPLKRAVGRGRDQGVLYAYAMEIPKVFWEEDMRQRHADAAEKVAALKSSPGRADGANVRAERSDQGKFYSPVEGSGKDFIEVDKR